MSEQANQQSLSAKAIRKARYQRQFARNKPAPSSNRYPAALILTPGQRKAAQLLGVPEYLQQVVRMKYGAKGTCGHGRYQHGTKKGPGRRPLGWSGLENPAGTKLVKRFIRDAQSEQIQYREIYAHMTGEQYHERYS